MRTRALTFILLFPLFLAAAQDWLGFHGLEHQGIGPKVLSPLSSPLERGANWKHPIPGRGFSSPVLLGNNVFLTTAYETSKGSTARKAASYATVALVFAMLFCVGVRLVGTLTQEWAVRRTLATAAWVITLAGIVFLMLGVSLFGETLFNLEGSTHRSWKIGTTTASAGICMMLLLAGRQASIAVLVGIASTILSAFAYLFMPRQDLFLNFRTSDGIISTGAVLLPALLSWAVVCMAHLFRTYWQEKPAQKKVYNGTVWLRVALCCGIPALLAGGLFWALMRRAARAAAVQAPLSPSVGWAFAGLMGLVALAGIVMWGMIIPRRQQSFGQLRSLAVVLSLLLGGSCFIRFACLPARRQLAFTVICVDRKTETIKWQREVAYSDHLADLKEINSRATPTLVATSDRICAYFGSAGLFGLDHAGQVKWNAKAVDSESEYGIGNSPASADGVVVLANDPEVPRTGPAPKSQVTAYSISDGHLIWRSERARTEPGSAAFATPIIRSIRGQKWVVVRGWEDLTAYDLQSGRVKWTLRLKHRGDHLVASVVADEKRLYLMDAARVMAFDLEALEAGRDECAWQVSLAGEKDASPVIVDGHLFGVTETGQAFCVEVEKGALKWKHKLKGQFFASIVTFGDHILFTSESGDLYFATRGPECTIALEKSLHENVYSTPVPQSDGLLVRTVDNLYCIAASEIPL